MIWGRWGGQSGVRVYKDGPCCFFFVLLSSFSLVSSFFLFSSSFFFLVSSRFFLFFCLPFPQCNYYTFHPSHSRMSVTSLHSLHSVPSHPVPSHPVTSHHITSLPSHSIPSLPVPPHPRTTHHITSFHLIPIAFHSIPYAISVDCNVSMRRGHSKSSNICFSNFVNSLLILVIMFLNQCNKFFKS